MWQLQWQALMSSETESFVGSQGRGEGADRRGASSGSRLVRQAHADRLSGQLLAVRHARASAAGGAQPWSQAGQVQSPAGKVAASAAEAAGATLRSAAAHLDSRGRGSSKHILAMISSLQSHMDAASVCQR